MRRLSVNLFAAAALILLGSACPPGLAVPDDPAGSPCEVDAECNVDDCGLLYACADGYCESEPSLAIPCDE